LIELLVVVSIISVLLTILLPSLRDARSQAKRVVCKNNLRSIWTGIRTYSLEYNDRTPFFEDPNLTDPNADPFDPEMPTSVGNVLFRYVKEKSWVCPAAVAGFPANAGRGKWKMTYTFSAAGPIGKGIPYDANPAAGTGDVLDPAVSNYMHFDGRPIRLLDGRRYVSVPALNHNAKGNWNVKRAVIADALAGQPMIGKPKYPHFGYVDKRLDLKAARKQFEHNSGGGGKKPAYYELHADGTRAEIYLTRFWVPHWPGY